jgi:dienelactone hydrolase
VCDQAGQARDDGKADEAQRSTAFHVRMRRWLPAALALYLSAGCGPAPTMTAASLTIVPTSSSADQPVDVLGAGLTSGQPIQLSMTSTDVHGVMWSSKAIFRPDAAGRLDLAKDAPQSGSYSGASGSGLLWSMRPNTGTTPYFWGPKPMTFTVTAAVSGQEVAHVSFMRRFAANRFSTALESLSARGFVGTYYSPPPDPGIRHPAVMVLGGSEGGTPSGLVAAHLASDGYPTLALAYFDEPGLPQSLTNIPLEYFATALRWLAAQPNVDPTEVVVMGASRGSEAALLLGVNYPELVHGVVASTPSNVALCGLPCQYPAWTLNGAPVPYTRQFDDATPTDVPSAVIPVERMRAPVLLDCGGSDQVWTSCDFANAIMARLDAHGYPFPHQLDAYPDAGHGLNGLIPYEPGVDLGRSAGRTPNANERADQLLWPKVLAFLAKLPGP